MLRSRKNASVGEPVGKNMRAALVSMHIDSNTGLISRRNGPGLTVPVPGMAQGGTFLTPGGRRLGRVE